MLLLFRRQSHARREWVPFKVVGGLNSCHHRLVGQVCLLRFENSAAEISSEIQGKDDYNDGMLINSPD